MRTDTICLLHFRIIKNKKKTINITIETILDAICNSSITSHSNWLQRQLLIYGISAENC